MALKMKQFDIHWLEEPINPPEDFDSLAKLASDTGVPIAAGENACTAFEFKKMIRSGAVSFAQPSVAKVGGITEFRKIAALAEVFGTQLMPHSPYFGPGFLATLHLAQSIANPGWIERIFIEPEAALYPREIFDPVGGSFKVSNGIGLGFEPDLDVVKTYRLD